MLFHGNIYSKNAEGTNKLLRDGAIVLTNYEDLLNYENN